MMPVKVRYGCYHVGRGVYVIGRRYDVVLASAAWFFKVRQKLGLVMYGALFACGGSTLPEPVDASPDVPSESTVEDSPGVTQKDGEKCGWKCMPVDGGTTAYVNTCTDTLCPGTGNCAAKPVPNVCADGGQ